MYSMPSCSAALSLRWSILRHIEEPVVEADCDPAALSAPLTAATIESSLKHGRADILETSPSLVEDLVSQESFHATLKELNGIIFGAGPLPKEAGDRLLTLNANSLHFFGATESGLMPLTPLDDPTHGWQYHRFMRQAA